MTFSEIISDITFKTGVSTSQYLLADRTRRINEWCRRVLVWILSSQDEWDFDDNNHTDFPILTSSLVANQQDYALPISDEGMLNIKRVEVTYDGTNWYKAEPMDKAEYTGSSDQTSINSYFSQSAPKYDLEYGSLMLYPIPTAVSSNGIKIWISRDISPFTVSDTTKTPGFDSIYHDVLSKGACYDWYEKTGDQRLAIVKRDLDELRVDLMRHYSSKQKDRNYRLQADYIDYK